MEESVNVKVVNHLNGEITEAEVKGPDAAEKMYFELQATAKAATAAMDQLKSYLDTWLGEDTKQPFADGHYIERVQRETRTWTRSGLRAIGLDDDAIEVASKIDMTVAKAIVKEAIEKSEVKPNAIKELDESAEVKVTKPYVQIK